MKFLNDVLVVACMFVVACAAIVAVDYKTGTGLFLEKPKPEYGMVATGPVTDSSVSSLVSKDPCPGELRVMRLCR